MSAAEIDDQVEAFRFELEAAEADRLGYAGAFWRGVRWELCRLKCSRFVHRGLSRAHNHTGRVKTWH